jgi:hypothetical protein
MGVTNFDIVQCDEFKLETAGDVVAQGTQKNHIADASVAHTISSTFSNTEVKGALDALGGKINLIIAALEEFGITKSS